MVQVQVTERVSANHVTNGFGQKLFTCTGSTQTLNVPATPFDRPFERGVAFAQTYFQACGSRGCVSDDAYRTIQIV